MNPDEVEHDSLTSFEMADVEYNYFTVGNLPVVMHHFCSPNTSISEFQSWDAKDMSWFVVEKFLRRQSHRDYNDDDQAIDYKSWGDSKHKLYMVQCMSY